MSPSLLPLFAALPIMAAALLVIVRVPAVERTLLVGVPLLSAAGGTALLVLHEDDPVIAHHVGGFVPGVAIPFVSDTFSAVMLVVTGVTTATCGAFLICTGEDRYRFVPPLALMLTGGVNGALLTGDLFNLFVFIEVMLLPSYALIALTGTWRRLGVGRLFILVNLMTSTILLTGVGFVYASAGTVNLALLAGAAAEDQRVDMAIAIVLTALGIKGGVVPVHGWLPRAYPATSAGIMALFSGLHTKVALYAIYRVYAMAYDGRPAPWLTVLAVLTVATMLVGAFSTVSERRIRPGLAFQMVSGIGHILVGLVVFSAGSIAAGIFYLVHHILTMGALLLSAGAIEHVYGTGRFDRLSGLMRREPVISAVTVLGLFSLVGLPPTSGLWGKAGIMIGAAEADGILATILMGAVILASVASLMALQRMWTEVFWGPPMERYRPDDEHTGRGEPIPITPDVRISKKLSAPAIVLMSASVLLFLVPGVLVPLTRRAAEGLINVQPYIEAVLTR